MSKSKFSFLTLIAALGAVSVVTVGVVGVVNNESLIQGAGTTTISCNYINFGTTQYTSTGVLKTASYSFSGNGFSLDSSTPFSNSDVYGNSSAGTYAARIGSSSAAGTVTFNLASPVYITSIGIDGFLYSTDSAKTASIKVTTSANTTGFSFTTTSTSETHFSDGGAFASDQATSSSFTIASQVVVRFELVKIRIETRSAAPTSSSESSASSSSSSSSSSTSIESGSTVSSSGSTSSASDISFHFLELGNAKTGDCTYIKAGTNDILIDAGSYYDSYTSISTAINQYCTDGKLEYVICTHAHTDHMAGFTHNWAKSTDTSGNGIFYNYKIGTIIDFAQANSTANIYDYYKYARSYAVSQGAVHYTALQCCNQTDGASKTYTLGTNLSMEILYQEYYASASSDENNNSVCVLFKQGTSNYFLFTGDLEAAGETSLISNNPSLPKVKLFKGAHHGSYTATSSALTAIIQPEMVAVCCCAGNTQYTSGADHVFPTQDFIDHVAPYTKAIYITTLGSFSDKSVFSSFNGQINIAYNAGVPTVACSNNNTILPLSEWFNKKGDLYDANTPNRVWPSNGVPL